MSVSSTALNPPQQLSSSVQPTVSSISSIDAAVNHMEALAVPSGLLVPSLPTHIQAAKEHGRMWTDSLRGEVVGALRSIVIWSEALDGMFNQLMELAISIGEGQDQAVPPFKALLTQLQQQTQAQQQQIQAVRPTLLSFIDAVNGDARNLAQDEDALKVILDSEQQEIDSLRREVASLQEQIQQKKAEEKILGLLNPAALLIIKVIESLTGQLDSTQQQLEQAERQLQQAQQQAQLAASTKALVDQYQQATGSLSTGINALSQGWDTLNANFAELLEGEDIEDFNAFTPDVLAAARKDWDELAQQVEQLLAGVGP